MTIRSVALYINKYDWVSLCSLYFITINQKQKIRNVLWLQLLLEDKPEEEEDKESSSEEEDNVILQAALIRRLNTRYLRPRIYHVAKSE